jgi:hypothetical protein
MRDEQAWVLRPQHRHVEVAARGENEVGIGEQAAALDAADDGALAAIIGPEM